MGENAKKKMGAIYYEFVFDVFMLMFEIKGFISLINRLSTLIL